MSLGLAWMLVLAVMAVVGIMWSSVPLGLAFAAVLVGTMLVHIKAHRAILAVERRNAVAQHHVGEMARVFEESPLAVAVCDTGLRLTYVNSAMAELDGRPARELIGQTLARVFSAENARSTGQALRQVVETGVPQFNVSRTLHHNGRLKQVVVSRYPVRDPDGVIAGVAVTFLDVSDKLRVADLEGETARLRVSAELVDRYEETQRIAKLGSWEIDLTTGIMTWSKQMLEILGADTSENDKAAIVARVLPEDRDELLAAKQRLLDAGEPVQLELRMTHSDGRVLSLAVTGRAVRGSDGAVIQLRGTVQDVTARVELEAARHAAISEAEAAKAEWEMEHAARQIVQRAMLPTEVAAVEGIEVGVAYRPVENTAEVGGDWYDAFVLPDGRLAVTIGDVAGHDLRAATTMGQIRNAIRAYAMEHDRPGVVLQRTNALLMTLPDPDLVTVVYGVYDLSAHELVFARAGHQPPLVRHGGRTVELVDPQGIALGALRGDRPYPEATVSLHHGDAVVLYTDGLVERRGSQTAPTVHRLARLIDGVAADVAATTIVKTVMDTMVAGAPIEDDICVLVLHRPDC